MIYLYDNAIADDLRKSFNPDEVASPVIKVISPDDIFNLAAQIQDDKIQFPLIAITRNDDVQIDRNLTNFTKMKKGIATVFDNETNELYYEKEIPVRLMYSLTVLTTNTAEMDEVIRELIFKYTHMYFLTIDLPYESSRKKRFGIVIDTDQNIQRSSGTGAYLQTGRLYQTIIPLRCEGAVMLNYTPVKLRRMQNEVEAVNPTGKK